MRVKASFLEIFNKSYRMIPVTQLVEVKDIFC